MYALVSGGRRYRERTNGAQIRHHAKGVERARSPARPISRYIEDVKSAIRVLGETAEVSDLGIAIEHLEDIEILILI